MDDLQSERTKISGPAPRSSVRVWGGEGCSHGGNRATR